MSDNQYLDLMQSEEDQRQQTLAAAHSSAFDINPEQAATRQRAARYLNLPAAVADALPAETLREAELKQIQVDTAPHPVLRQKYSDADFMALARDDSGVLGKLSAALAFTEQSVGETTAYFMGADGGNGVWGDVVASLLHQSAGAATGRRHRISLGE